MLTKTGIIWMLGGELYLGYFGGNEVTLELGYVVAFVY